MNKNDITTAVILEKRKIRKDGRYPVKLRVTYKREQRYYTLRNETGESITMFEKDFSKTISERPREPYKRLAVYLNKMETQAREIIEKNLPVFTFTAFEKKFFSDIEDEQDLLSGFKSSINQLMNEGRVSTAVSYKCTLNSIQKYYNKRNLGYADIDKAFLNKYEKWMLDEWNSLTTIGIYLRNVRTMFNKAINTGIISKEYYPFGEGKYQIPGGRNIKKALTLKDVGLIASYPTIKGTNEQRYRDYWLFSYLCNGINVKDMALLKYSNIDEDVIIFKRAKTQREKRENPRLITIVITKQIGRIIDKWSNKPAKKDNFIFPILENGLTSQQEYARIQQTTKMINKYIGRISETIGITQKVTSYTARHSFTTVLKRSGASTEFISESLGHSNLLTTENYLADFEIDVKRQWAEKLSKCGMHMSHTFN